MMKRRVDVRIVIWNWRMLIPEGAISSPLERLRG